MDAFSDPLIEKVVFVKSTQVGATEIIGNIIGYYIDQDPSPIMLVQPTLELAKAYSKDRLAPMLRDTPRLHGRVRDRREKDSDNTVTHKTFHGGHITLAGANTATALRARPIRILLFDEVDGYPHDVDGEGDPCDLGEERTKNFWNRKIFYASTPTVAGISRIEAEYEESDKREYYVPCTHCDTFQTLKWRQVEWEKNDAGDHTPETAVYVCEECGVIITDGDKPEMLARGQWRAKCESAGIAGFHINALYSPWVSFGQLADKFLRAKRKGSNSLKTFVNTSLGESWSDGGESIDADSLFNRREDFGRDLPAGVGFLTAGVDVQGDRLEAEIVGWGIGKESWSIDYRTIWGDPSRPDVWRDLDEVLSRSWRHESGLYLNVGCACVDSGYMTQAVYDYVRPRQGRRIFAVKGSSQSAAPPVRIPKKTKTRMVRLCIVGSDTLKGQIYSWLKVTEFGPGYMHFPKSRDSEYFQQLTAETIVTRKQRGFEKREWVKTRARNEALDIRVYALAALEIVQPDLALRVKQINGETPAERKGNGRRFISEGVKV
jgi:phage terminase large subunit GpA-like protein